MCLEKSISSEKCSSELVQSMISLVLGNFATDKRHRRRIKRISIGELKLELECLTLIDAIGRRINIYDPSVRNAWQKFEFQLDIYHTSFLCDSLSNVPRDLFLIDSEARRRCEHERCQFLPQSLLYVGDVLINCNTQLLRDKKRGREIN